MAYLDNDGLLYFWQKMKEKLAGKVDVVSGKDLSTNDYTDTEKEKLAGIEAGANAYTHPSHTAYASGLYKVTVDALGHVSAASAVAKSDITALGIPDTTYSTATTSTAGLMSASDKSKLDGFGSAGTYALKTDITSMYRYKGTVDTVSDLPTSGNTVGDVYDVGSGMNYAWNGSSWDALGESLTINSISNTEIDTILAS